MENSMSCKPLISSSSNLKTTGRDSSEESGWTMYFDDLFAQNNGDDQDNDQYEQGSFSYDQDGNSSLVSDAASLVLKKSAGDDHGEEQVGGIPIDNKKSFRYSLSFKKRRTKGALIDDSLEDTASSPVNSPKVYDGMMINQYRRNTNQKDNMEISLDEGSGSKQQVDKRSDFDFLGGGGDNTALKKKGLCLVPLSMVVNYLG
ncbi:hypothetical protein OIU76_019148 [Salix suchowensis]|uniref:Uncharacterized protein n=2 Tax=Salix TaxID=40685 RepID=A0A9Q1AM65_9ROSI|nr:Lysine-specific demethylase [Salix suchowensis]KAJ6297968.1 hypothetical protein OIU76_019148 [Salix suchowensis]KAJ6301069.1 hypothetical protein OIU77_015386 [Salix suchowensis]KAJ6314084.1 hypothetical protein OIU78_017695 [Salix suchowensis]KAJ6776459.1 VASCULAR-RELATED UNKNOWN PROTEIN 1-RELATED [Salix koriyanagi]